jgi:hypothetical protein
MGDMLAFFAGAFVLTMGTGMLLGKVVAEIQLGRERKKRMRRRYDYDYDYMGR